MLLLVTRLDQLFFQNCLWQVGTNDEHVLICKQWIRRFKEKHLFGWCFEGTQTIKFRFPSSLRHRNRCHVGLSPGPMFVPALCDTQTLQRPPSDSPRPATTRFGSALVLDRFLVRVSKTFFPLLLQGSQEEMLKLLLRGLKKRQPPPLPPRMLAIICYSSERRSPAWSHPGQLGESSRFGFTFWPMRSEDWHLEFVDEPRQGGCFWCEEWVV